MRERGATVLLGCGPGNGLFMRDKLLWRARRLELAFKRWWSATHPQWDEAEACQEAANQWDEAEAYQEAADDLADQVNAADFTGYFPDDDDQVDADDFPTYVQGQLFPIETNDLGVHARDAHAHDDQEALPAPSDEYQLLLTLRGAFLNLEDESTLDACRLWDWLLKDRGPEGTYARQALLATTPPALACRLRDYWDMYDLATQLRLADGLINEQPPPSRKRGK